MGNYKVKDIIVIVVAASVFVAALIFIFEGSGSSTKSTASSSDLIDEPQFVSDYDTDTYAKLEKFIDYGNPDPQGLCKGNLFSIEAPLAPDQQCYALEQLGLLSNTQETAPTEVSSQDQDSDEASKNTLRRSIANTAKTALAAYSSKNKDYPASPGDKQVYSLLKTGGALNAFVPSSGVYEDPSQENTRICYARRSTTQYWLYIVTEPTDAPEECVSDDPKSINGVEDFSLR